VMRIDTPPPLMGSLREEVPAAVDAVVRRALEPDRDRRWADLAGFLTALRTAHETGELPPGLEPVTALPGDRLAPVGIGEQRTALSSTSMPTMVGAGPVPATAEAPEPVKQAAAERAADQAETEAGRGGRRRAQVIAGLAALVLVAAGGYAGYEAVSRRPVKVTDTSGQLSVEAPRSWSEKAIDGWTPPGRPAQPGLLVSVDTAAWQSSAGAHGVFVGIVPGSTLPATVSMPSGCASRQKAPDRGSVDRAPAVTFRFECANGTWVVERFVQVAPQKSLRVQVRAGTAEQAEDVLASAAYRPG
jgi:hypothetical protein